MKRLRRPSLSESRPKNSAPTTSPTRYTVARRPTAAEDRPRVSGWLSVSATALATVISRPSRIHATPSATTIRVWNGDQGSRSMRAGIRLRTAPGAGVFAAVVIAASRFFYRDDHCGAFWPGSVVPPRGRGWWPVPGSSPRETERVSGQDRDGGLDAHLVGQGRAAGLARGRGRGPGPGPLRLRAEGAGARRGSSRSGVGALSASPPARGVPGSARSRRGLGWTTTSVTASGTTYSRSSPAGSAKPGRQAGCAAGCGRAERAAGIVGQHEVQARRGAAAGLRACARHAHQCGPTGPPAQSGGPIRYEVGDGRTGSPDRRGARVGSGRGRW